MDQPAVASPAPFASETTPAEREAFARLLVSVLQEVGEGREIRYTPSIFQLILVDPGGGGGSAVNLGSLFEVHRRMPEPARAGWLNALSREIVESTPLGRDLEAVRDSLLPLIRGRTFDDRTRPRVVTQTDAPPPARFALSEHHDLGLAIPRGSLLHEADAAALKRWQLSSARALGIVRTNLGRALPHPFEERGPGLHASEGADGNDAARMVLTDQIRKLPLRGAAVAVVPHAGLILISATDEEEGLQRLAAAADGAFDHPDRISGVVVKLDGERWVPWLPPAAHPAFAALDSLRARSIERDYAEQKVALEARLQREHSALFVATHAVATSANGQRTSSCTWRRGTPALLPRTDELILVDPSRPPMESVVAIGSWERITAVVGRHLKPQGLNPERWETTSFPAAAELEMLRR